MKAFIEVVSFSLGFPTKSIFELKLKDTANNVDPIKCIETISEVLHDVVWGGYSLNNISQECNFGSYLTDHGFVFFFDVNKSCKRNSNEMIREIIKHLDVCLKNYPYEAEMSGIMHSTLLPEELAAERIFTTEEIKKLIVEEYEKSGGNDYESEDRLNDWKFTNIEFRFAILLSSLSSGFSMSYCFDFMPRQGGLRAYADICPVTKDCSIRLEEEDLGIVFDGE